MKRKAFLLGVAMAINTISVSSFARPSVEVFKKIVSQGVPAPALTRLVDFMDENKNRTFQQDTYKCAGKSEESISPCHESERSRSSSVVTLGSPRKVAIVDFTKPSTERRFFLIDLSSGVVQKYYGAHGIGSGNSKDATIFSNTKDSRQTSLGIYLTGGTYYGKYGKTLRMYGLQRSNDQAYMRDIVLHGAWYVGEDFINSRNPKTEQPFGRLGVSWGCPAVSTAIAQKIIPILEGGSLIMHYHEAVQDQSLSGQRVEVGVHNR